MSRWYFLGFNRFTIHVDPLVLGMSLLSLAALIWAARKLRRSRPGGGR